MSVVSVTFLLITHSRRISFLDDEQIRITDKPYTASCLLPCQAGHGRGKGACPHGLNCGTGAGISFPRNPRHPDGARSPQVLPAHPLLGAV